MQFTRVLRTPLNYCHKLNPIKHQLCLLNRSGVLTKAFYSNAQDSNVSKVELPNELIISRQDDAEVLEEFVVTFKTGMKRGSSLSEPLSGVFLCLIGANRKGSLHFISPLSDTGHSSSGVRFLQGAVDIVRVSNPHLGPLVGLLIGPESGTWNLDEVHVQSKTTGQTLKFVCRTELGTKANSAALLSPLPPGVVLYGSGTTAMCLNAEQSEEIRKVNLDSYKRLKQTIIFINTSLVALGSVLEAMVWGVPFASLFALGGIGGIAYEFSLQESVDVYGNDTTDESRLLKGRLKKFLASPILRASIVAFLVITVYSFLQFVDQESTSFLSPSSKAQQLLNVTAGFLMFKVATFGTIFVSDNSESP